MHFRRKMADCTYGFQRSSAGSLQWSGFREKPTIFLPPLPAEYVTVFSGWTDTPEVSCDLTDTLTHTHTRLSTVTLAAHARQGLIIHVCYLCSSCIKWENLTCNYGQTFQKIDPTLNKCMELDPTL